MEEYFFRLPILLLILLIIREKKYLFLLTNVVKCFYNGKINIKLESKL